MKRFSDLNGFTKEFQYKRCIVNLSIKDSDHFGPKMAFRTDVSHYDVVESLLKRLNVYISTYISVRYAGTYSFNLDSQLRQFPGCSSVVLRLNSEIKMRHV